MTSSVNQDLELALGHFLTLRRPPDKTQAISDIDLSPPVGDGWTELRFQNFFIQQTATWNGNPHLFLPFGFSGISINRAGYNVDASLVFPKNTLSMAFSDFAIKEQWTAVVRVVWIQNIDNPQQQPTQLHIYQGQIAAGSWAESTISLTTNSVLDAVAANVPARSLTQQLVGNVPFTGQISLR